MPATSTAGSLARWARIRLIRRSRTRRAGRPVSQRVKRTGAADDPKLIKEISLAAWSNGPASVDAGTVVRLCPAESEPSIPQTGRTNGRGRKRSLRLFPEPPWFGSGGFARGRQRAHREGLQ